MIAAGIEGGSKRRIEEDWSLEDYRAQRDYWIEYGPPLNIAAIAISTALGIELISKKPKESEEEIPLSGPSIEELTKLAQTKIERSGDTMNATKAVLLAMNGGDGK